MLCAITNIDEADVTFAKTRRVKVVDDVDAPKVFLSEEDIMSNYPLTYKDVCDKCRIEIDGFKQNKDFNVLMTGIKDNPVLCYTRRLNPRSKSSSKTTFYSAKIIDEIKKTVDKSS